MLPFSATGMPFNGLKFVLAQNSAPAARAYPETQGQAPETPAGLRDDEGCD
jgi:hypothetical protein